MQTFDKLSRMIGGGKIPEVLVGTWIVMGILHRFSDSSRDASLATPPIRLFPTKDLTMRSVAEMIVEWARRLRSVKSPSCIDSRAIVPFFGTHLHVHPVCQFSSVLIPGMEPPTGDSDLTFGLGTICFGYYIYQGFASKGVSVSATFLGPYLAAGGADAADRAAPTICSGLFRWAFVFTRTCLPIIWCSAFSPG